MRQQRLLVGALNFHVLENPGSSVRIHLRIGRPGEYAELTRVHDVAPFSDSDAAAVEVIGSGPMLDRYVIISSDENSTVSPSHGLRGLYWRTRQRIERRYPLQYDRVRQLLLASRERRLRESVIPRALPNDAGWGHVAVSGGPRAVIVGMHWLELGGAETWAIETIRLIKETGAMPIVLTDRDSQHPLIATDALDDALVLPFTFFSDQADDVGEQTLQSILSSFTVEGVVVHHCNWLYRMLPSLKAARPSLPVMDSLHILEYAGGGYPALAVQYDPYISVHHVISPVLERWLVDHQEVDAEKVAMAPLLELTAEQERQSSFVSRAPDEPLTIAFIGRFVRQKRPYLFSKLVSLLAKDGVNVRAIMQGSGELEHVVRSRLVEAGIQDLVDVRDHTFPVSETLRESHLLVVSSQNEGITLTTIEAIAAGVPVLSADVGSQATLVSADFLVSREPGPFLRDARRLIAQIEASEELRRAAWDSEFARAHEFSLNTDASHWARKEFASWATL